MDSCIDFETYSEAGYVWNGDKWRSITTSPPHGLSAVGAPAYSEHPSTEVLSLAYNVGAGPRLWLPGMPAPEDLFNHFRNSGLVEAWNSQFEYFIWVNVCHARMRWPFFHWSHFRDGMPKARAYGLPGKLQNASEIIGIEEKSKTGKSLIQKFCKPRNPTKNNPSTRNQLHDFPDDAQVFYAYNLQDIVSEASVSNACPELIPKEQSLWLLDQKINYRGVQVDQESLSSCLKIADQCFDRYTEELREITTGKVGSANQVAVFKKWLESRGVFMQSLSAETVESTLHTGLPDPVATRALQLRQKLGNASVKKLRAIERMVSCDGRLRGLFAYCGADRTGRWAGRGPQPQNLPAAHLSHGTVDEALEVIATGSLDAVELHYGDALDAISACLRGLFVSAPGSDLISSDYSAIEAVVLAALAGEDWRLEVFHTHGMIYEVSASKTLGLTIGEMMLHKQQTGEHHPARRMGKYMELSCGFGGGVGAWRAFGGEGTDDEIKRLIKQWRQASPSIVNFWHDCERAAIAAVKNPNLYRQVREIYFLYDGTTLRIRLPSERCLYYHAPIVSPDVTPWGTPTERLTYMSWSNTAGWHRTDTYGGKICENITQGVARDLLGHAMPQLEAMCYPVVLHVHDEIVSEVKSGYGSVEIYEEVMTRRPRWAADWPIRASGGWRGYRYRK